MPIPVKKLQTESESLNRVQDGIVSALNGLLTVPILDGRLLETLPDANGHEAAIVLGATALNIPHKLARQYRGYKIVEQNANAVIWADTVTGSANNPDPSKFVRLLASATVTVKLWVF